MFNLKKKDGTKHNQFKTVHSKHLVLKRNQNVYMSIYRFVRPALIKYERQDSFC